MSKPTLKFRFTVRNKTSEEFTVRRADFVIGRSDECRVRIPFPEVSRQHCRITVDEANQVLFADLRSGGMGIWHNGRQEHQGVLAVGDKMFIGYTCVELIEFIPAGRASDASSGHDSHQIWGQEAAKEAAKDAAKEAPKAEVGTETSVLPALTLCEEMPAGMSCSMSTTDIFNSLLAPGQAPIPHSHPAAHGGR